MSTVLQRLTFNLIIETIRWYMNTSAAAHPEIACVVLSLGSPPVLVDAVRSLVEQDTPCEILVVNSGGGGAADLLRRAGLNVPVIECAERLYAGGARNLGIQNTRAPYIAFLASDCIAEPGWVRARLERHRSGALAVSTPVTNFSPHSRAAWASYFSLFAHRMPGTPPETALHYGVSYARSLFERFGLFDDTLRTGEDTDFNRRLADHVPLTWEPRARTAHRHPTRLLDLLRDQAARGRRALVATHHLTGTSLRGYFVRQMFTRMRTAIKAAEHAATAEERRALRAARPYLLPAAIAYTAGVLTARLEPVTERAAQPAPADPPPARRRVLGLLVFHNEMRYLPGFFANVSRHVDGIIALDDGSTDGSGEFVSQQAGILELIRLPPRDPHVWDEPAIHRQVTEAAWRHGPDWLMAIDADERLEDNWRARADAVIAQAERDGVLAFYVRVFELWDAPDTVRVDGVWGRKRSPRLFRARRDHEFDTRALHGFWAPLNSRIDGDYPLADLLLYHLKTMHASDRSARRARYQQLDPLGAYQPLKYDYLTDELGMRLSRLPEGRGYSPQEWLWPINENRLYDADRAASAESAAE